MNRYRLVHVTEFHYDGPVSESYNEVRLRPRHDDRQSCISFRLTTTPQAPTVAHRDMFENLVHQFNVLGEHRYLKVEAESVVLIHDSPPAPPDTLTLAEFDAMREELREEYFDLVAATNYVPHPDALREFVREAEERSSGMAPGFARAASELVHGRFRYEQGATHVHSSIGDSLETRAGVCQDFAHILLAILRMRGFPAYYVSGYLVPKRAVDAAERSMEEVIGGQASHAWVEVYVAGAGWMALDPTLGAPVSTQHVRLALGRDYGDVAPVRGVYRGHAGQRLSVDVLVRPVLDDEGREHWTETAAGPPQPPALQSGQPQQQ
ncbi:MAG: transglutaminase family protein [Bryobacteraceae bacterium]|nr:transglutaminase family protein [Bryobacteraceae bacterium]